MIGRTGGTTTLLFTDIVGSTGLSNRLGEVVTQSLRRANDRILREEFARFGGWVVKHTGDGFMVAFESAQRAVQCAVAVQLAIEAQHNDGRYLELHVRAGLHTGEPVADGDDLFGADVNLAARIVAEAEADQVLVSEVTYLLTRRNTDLRFVPAGDRILKGFEKPMALFAVSGPERRLPKPVRTRFVGRGEELARLLNRLELAGRGQGSVVLVTGDAGVGKTRLLSELAVQAADRGFEVMRGSAYETQGMPPYLPLSEALGQLPQALDPGELQEALGDYAAYVAKVLPSLTQRLSDIEQTPALSPDAERYRLFEGCSDFLLKVTERGPVLLVLDDMHWADQAAILLLRHLAHRLARASILVVVAYRAAGAGEQHALDELVDDLKRGGIYELIRLIPLGRDEAAALAEAILGASPARQVTDQLFAVTEGNPFFAEEFIRDAQEQGHDLTDPSFVFSGLPIPEGLRHVVKKRLTRLPEEAQLVLAYASVLGRDFTVPEVAAVTEKDEDLLLNLMDEALVTQVLREQGDGFVFAHPLIREALYRGQTGARRRLMHRRVAEALEVMYSSDREGRLAELAHHFFEGATREEDLGKSATYALRGAEAALAVCAYEGAVSLYGLVLHALERFRDPDETRRCDALLALGDAQAKAGDGSGAGQTFQNAAELAKAGSRVDQLARAALGFGEVRHVAGFVDEPLLEVLKEALDALGDESSALRARVLARYIAALYHSAPHEQLLSLSQQAVDMARESGDTATLVYVLGAVLWFLQDPHDIERRLATADEIIELADAVGDREGALEAIRGRLADLLESGDIVAFDAELEIFSRRAEELRQPFFLWRLAVCRCMRALMKGQFVEAERLAMEALALGRETQSGTEFALQIFGVQMFQLRREQGRLDELEGAVTRFIEQFPASRWAAALVYVHCELGRDEEARRGFERLSAGGFTSIARDFNWVITLVTLSEICACLGDEARAGSLYELLLPYAGRSVTVADHAGCYGSVSRSLGVLATTMGRWDEAERHFEDAVEFNQRIAAMPMLAQTQQEFGALLLGRDRPGDREKAVALATAALRTAEELGMKRIIHKAKAVLIGAAAVKSPYDASTNGGYRR